jgi:hypothetical protein
MIEPATTIIPAESGAALVSGYYGSTTAAHSTSTGSSFSTTIVGLIAGGAIGCIFAISIIAAGVVIIYRRHLAHRNLAGTKRLGEKLPELPSDREITELSGKSLEAAAELSTESYYVELQTRRDSSL